MKTGTDTDDVLLSHHPVMEMNALCGRVFVLQLYLKFLVMSL